MRVVIQEDIPDPQVAKFLNPGGGIVQQAKQSRIPAAIWGRFINLFKDELQFTHRQKTDCRFRCLCSLNRQNLLALQKELRFSALEVLEKCMYYSQTLVRSSIRISPAVLKPLNKTGNHLGRYHVQS